MADLDELLKNVRAQGSNGDIDLRERIIQIKERARMDWLANLDRKNGYKHSERLEGYLVDLTGKLREKGKLSPSEVFVLLCAAYLHDIGYWHNGKPVSEGHQKRGQEAILHDPAKYLLGDFLDFSGKHPLVAEAIALICYAHSDDDSCPLANIRSQFTDDAFPDKFFDLRKLAALLRLADEADDPYTRETGGVPDAFRSQTNLVSIEGNTIRWHWDPTTVEEPYELQSYLERKMILLKTSLDYLREQEGGSWYIVLDPPLISSIPFMAGAPVETFVGREKDLEDLHVIIRKRAIGAITGVVGTGGIGKTELARMYAERYRAEYPGGVLWASLKGSTWRLEGPKLLAALRPGSKPQVFPDDGKAKEEVIKALKGKQALLVIDNVNEADEIVRPTCFVLVTTRNRDAFGMLPPKAIHWLSQFDRGEGMQLLAEIVGKERVMHDPDGAGRIVDILGGMPLALDIAAHHLDDAPDLSFPDYIGDIQGRIRALKVKGVEDMDVAASLELSLAQLEGLDNGKELISIFEAACVCAEAGFSSRTLGETAGLAEKGKRRIGELVGKVHLRSLLEYDPAAQRYTMHPLVRQMAEERLLQDTNKAEFYRRNHSRHFLRFAEAHEGDPADLVAEKNGLWQAMIQTIQLGEVEVFLPDFLRHLAKPYQALLKDREYEEAFQYLVAVNLINIDDLGLVKDLVTVLDPLIQNEEQLEASSCGWLYNNAGIAYANLGDYRKAIELYEKALGISRRIGDVQGEGNVLGNMGIAYANLGEHRKAIDLYEKRLEIARRIGDVQGEGKALGNMGIAYKDLGEYRKAIELYEKRLEIARRIGDVQGEGNVLGNMGVAYANLGEHRKAIELYEKQLDITRRIGDVQGEGKALGNMGIAYKDLGEYRKAIELYEKALGISRRIGDVRGEGNAFGNMGVAYAELKDQKRCRECLEASRAIFKRIGLLHMVSQVEQVMEACGVAGQPSERKKRRT